MSPSKKSSAANVTHGGACSSESGAVSPGLWRRRIVGDPSAGPSSGTGERSAAKAGGRPTRTCAHRHRRPGPQGSGTPREGRPARALERISGSCLVSRVSPVARLRGRVCLAASPAQRLSQVCVHRLSAALGGPVRAALHSRAPARIDRLFAQRPLTPRRALLSHRLFWEPAERGIPDPANDLLGSTAASPAAPSHGPLDREGSGSGSFGATLVYRMKILSALATHG